MADPATNGTGSNRELRIFRWLTASERRSWIWLAILAFVTRLPLLAYPKACDDEQVYAVVANEMLHGGRPYVDAVERKPPFLFYLYEAVLRVGGEHNYFSLHVASLIWTIATMAVMYLVARRLFDAASGFVAALLYAVFTAWADYTNLAFNGELMMNLPVVAAFALTFHDTKSKLRIELFAAGALVALAFLLKQPAAIAGVPLGIYLLQEDYRAKRGLGWDHTLLHCLLLLLGFTAALGGAVLFLRHVRILDEAYYWTITNHANPMGPTTWFFWHKLPPRGAFFVAETLPLLLGTAYAIGAGWRRTGPWGTRRAEWVACVVLLFVSVLGVTANGQFNYHYFLQLTPPLALLAAPIFADLWTGKLISRNGWPKPVLLARWVGLCALLFLTVDSIGLSRNRVPKKEAVFVRERSSENDRIFIWGQGTAQTGLYLDARRRPASRYIASFPLNGLIFGLLDHNHDTRYRIVPGAWDHLRDDFARHPPKFIIDCHAVRDGPFYKIRDYAYLNQLLTTEFQEVYRDKVGIVYQRIAGATVFASQGG